MIKNIFLGLFTLLTVSSFSQEVFGTWKTIDDETGKEKSYIKIYKSKNGKIYGKVTKILDPKKQDATCEKCDGYKKDKPVMGMLIIEGLTKDGKRYNGGTITDPNNGKAYDCEIWMEGDDLIVRGYMYVGFLGRSQTWKRVS